MPRGSPGSPMASVPYRIDQLAHLQVLSSYWMPLALLGLHRYLAEPRWQWLTLFGLSSLLQGLSNGYYLLFFPVLVAGWLVWFLPSAHRWKRLGAVGVAWGLSLLPVVPVLWRYQQVHARFGFVRPLEEIRPFGGGRDRFDRGIRVARPLGVPACIRPA